MKLLIRNLCKKYDEVTVIGNASYTFETGRVYSVLGAAKSGKTTLLDCIGREVVADSGSIGLEGDFGAGVKKVDYVDFGFVTGEPMLTEYMTGRDYVRYCIRLHGGDEGQIDGYFSLLGMGDDTLDMLIREYTDGEKQALQMIGIMAVDPPVILMDDPFGKDKGNAAQAFIEAMKSDHIIIMTADSIERAIAVSDELLILNHGAIEGFDTDALSEDRAAIGYIEEIITESGENTDA